MMVDFREVAPGLSAGQAVKEAGRCLDCRNPCCVEACPVRVDIPGFISLIKKGDFAAALRKIKEKNSLPAICGRVCPQEDKCEGACILGKAAGKTAVDIGSLERFVADYGLAHKQKGGDVSGRGMAGKTGEVKIAVVGSGPAGLTAAGELAKIGYGVTLFESLHIPGGVLVYGIPEFRLPKEIVRAEVDYVRSLGVEIKTDVLVGKTLTVDDLFRAGYKAIFLATGAGLPRFLGIPGENLAGVYSANEFLTRINLMQAWRFPEYATPLNVGPRVAVVGGGNVAFDCARCARRLGGDVELVYRRSRQEMPARKEEISRGEQEGVRFRLLTSPVKVLGDERGRVKGLQCVRMELGEEDSSGRRRPRPVAGSEFSLDIDTLIVAIGQGPNPLLTKNTAGLKLNPDGTIRVDGHYRTSIPGVFAGGDIITGADTVIAAMGAGRRAAKEIVAWVEFRLGRGACGLGVGIR